MQTAKAADPLLELSESEMAGRIAAGDRVAFAALMRRHNQKLYRTARSILRDDAEAEDAVQEAYLIAFRALPGFRGDAKLSTWLVRIVVNEALGRLRKRKRDAEVIHLGHDDDRAHDALEATMDDAPFPQPERAALRAETRRLLEAKIDLLPEAFRTVFMLRAVEEMSVEETAAAYLGAVPVFGNRDLARAAVARASARRVIAL
jgi:RNA polymerase sigma-70 factor (ECF subfamily)